VAERAEQSGVGVVTFLFTDLVGSTQALSRLGDDGAEALRQTHFSLLRSAIKEDAEEVKNLGDGLMLAFTSPLEAVSAAVHMQKAIAEHNADATGEAIAVRIGIHAGEPVREDGDYFGTPVVIAKRLCDAANGGQILAGELVAALVGTRGSHRFRTIGPMELKGLTKPVTAVEVDWSGSAPIPVTAPRSAARRPRRPAAPRGPELVGRAEELALLEDEYAAAGRGELHCVLLVGDPGVGKTRLAAELLARREAAATVLRARAHPMATTVAFGLWAEALDPYLQVLGDDEIADICGGFLDDLAGLFHRVAAVHGPGVGGEAPRPRLLAGLTRIVDEATRRGPVVVLFDDIHWADASSWEVLRHLARQLDAAPLMVVLTARPAELAAHEVAGQVLFELEQDGLLTRLDVATLDAAGLRELAEQVTGAPPPAALVEWLTRRSEGNALFAIGLLRALLEEGADLAAPALTKLPENLAERVTARLRRAAPEHMALLDLVAVVGGPVPLADLATLAGRPVAELGPMLAEIVASRGLVEFERGRTLTYEFTHPLVRDVVYDHMGGARRRLLHRQVARMLREAGRVTEAALHYARSADPGDPEAVDALVAALREAEAREAVSEGLGLLGELVELLPPTDRRWLDVLEAMNWHAEWLADHRVDLHVGVTVRALRAMDALLDASDDAARRGVVKLRLAYFLGWGLGEVDDAESACTQAHALFERAGQAHGVLLADLELAWISGLRGDFAAMHAQAERVLAATEAEGDRPLVMRALAASGGVALVRGRLAEWRSSYDRVAEIARADGKNYRLSQAQLLTAIGLAMEGRVDEGRRLVAEVKVRDSFRNSVVLDYEAHLHLLAGDFPAALAVTRESERLVPGDRFRRLPRLIFGALAATEMGEHAEAQRAIERAEAIQGDRDFFYFQPMRRHAAALLDWSRGDLDKALPVMASVIARLAEMDAHGFAYMGADVAEAAAEAADPAAATHAAHVTSESATRTGHGVLFEGLADVAGAWAALAAGEPARGAEPARAAVDALTGTGLRCYLARAHDVLGRCLLGSDRAAGVAELERAAALFGDCGAVWRRGRTLEVLRRQGSAGRRAMAAALGPGSLTRRELDVARLAAQGLSAREIAEALFVGERTVETHLGNVYAKLGVESKLDLVRRAGELSLL
jgi:class 3 adenylate cyclase/DNA-binding CsgD family transcriptional regulator